MISTANMKEAEVFGFLQINAYPGPDSIVFELEIAEFIKEETDT
jgi:hypothetical protein